MTVTAAEARKEYAGNGATTAFTYPYQFFQVDDLDVWLFDDLTGVGVQQVLGTDYSVTGALSPTGGEVTFAVAPPAGQTVIIINDPDIYQPLHYVNADDFPAESHEQGLDRLTKICQRLSDRIDRAVRAPDYAPEDQVPDAQTLVDLVDDAENAALSAQNSANEAEAHDNAAQTAATTATTAASAAAASAASANMSAVDAANSAAAAQVAEVDWKGPWDGATTYMKNDAVNSGGSSYISKTDGNVGNMPPNPTHWDVLALKGNDGTGGGGGGGDMLAANNLSDVQSVSTSRNNLGLGDAATMDIGTTAGTVMAGDDPRVTSAPAPATATPLRATNLAAVGVSTKYAREDHVHPSRFSDLNAVPNLAAGTDLNTVTSSGYYAVNNAVNGPPTGIETWHYVRVHNFSVTPLYVMQWANIMTQGSAAQEFMRMCNNGTWGAWLALVDGNTLAAYAAPINSPLFTGNPRAPTPTAGDNDTSLATTEFVQTAIGSGLPASQVCVALLPSIAGAVTTSNTHVYIMKDGSVRVGGGAGVVGDLGFGAFALAINPARKLSLPAGLLGKPIAAYHVGSSWFIRTDQGDVCGWGDNSQGQLGVGNTTQQTIPTLLNATNITPRSAGGANRAVVEMVTTSPNGDNNAYGSVYFRCADGTMWACGYNTNGQLGDSTVAIKNVPTQCLKNDGAGNVAVTDCAKMQACGGANGSAGYIGTDGKVRLAGRLSAGAVGRNTASGAQNVFRPIFTVTDNAGSALPAAYQALDIIMGVVDTVVIRCADKCAYAWGYGGYGTIGNGGSGNQLMPVKVGTGTAVAATLNGTVERIALCAMPGAGSGMILQLTDGTMYGCGDGAWYETPHGTAGVQLTPKLLTGVMAGVMPNLVSVAAAGFAGSGVRNGSWALFADGRITAWGLSPCDGSGSNSVAAAINSLNFIQPRMPAGVIAIAIRACGGYAAAPLSSYYMEILYSNGEVWCIAQTIDSGSTRGVLDHGCATGNIPTANGASIVGEIPAPQQISFFA